MMPVSGQLNLPITCSDRDLDAKLPGLTRSSSAVRHWVMVTMKEYAAWHGRINNLVFFFILLFTGIVLGVCTTLSAVGFYGNPESGFLSTSFTSFSSSSSSFSSLASNGSSSPDTLKQHLDADSDATPPNNEVNAISEVSDESTNWASSSTWTDPLYEERREVYHGNTSDFLGDHPVDLSLLSDAFHHMSDEELLRQASSIVATTSTEDMDLPPKVAFLFLTRGPLPFAPLWERYFRGHGGLYSIYIHAHPHFRPNVSSASVFFRRNVPSKEVAWGRLSVFTAERRLLANALLDPANDRFVLLSESCIPVAPFLTAYKYYTESQHSFVDCFVNAGKGGLGRYNRIRNREKLNPEISPAQWRKGSQWFEMSRELAATVVSDRKYYAKFENIFCRDRTGICYIDEHYVPTVLAILHPTKLANRTTTFIDFSRSAAHPYQWEPPTITEDRMKKITASGRNCTYNGQITHTCFMFARKFSPGCLEPLLALASPAFGIP